MDYPVYFKLHVRDSKRTRFALPLELFRVNILL